jgi:hypothetical protein
VKVKRPLSPVIVVRVAWVASLTNSTVASETLAAVGSVTDPSILPTPDWADEKVGQVK